MKTKILFYIVFATCSMLFTACDQPQPENDKPLLDEMVEVSLKTYSISADITDESMTKETPQEEVYAVLVRENFNGTLTNYCYGVFNSLDGVKLKLNKNRTYDIHVAKYWDYFSKYYFQLTTYTTTNYYTYINSYTNDFVYLEAFSFSYKDWYKEEKNNSEGLYDGAMFYGVAKDYSPDPTVACSVELQRNDSELVFTVEGLTDGELICYIQSTNNWTELKSPSLTSNNNTWTQTFSYYRYTPIEDVVGTDNTEYGCRITVDYRPTQGDVIEDLWTQQIKFIKGMRKRVILKLSKEDTSTTQAGINITIANDEFTEDTQSEYDAKY